MNIMPIKKWSDHKTANEHLRFLTWDMAESKDLRLLGGRGKLLFHVLVGGDGMTSVRGAYRADSQLRAEQAALAWTRAHWARDGRALEILETHIVD